MKKKIIICVLIIFVILLLLFNFVSLYIFTDLWFNIKMISVDKDIIIEKVDTPMIGGYANSSLYYYIDLDKKKMYEVTEYNIWGITSKLGEEGEHYFIENTKKLSDKEIEDILQLYETSKMQNSSPAQTEAPIQETDDLEGSIPTYPINNTSYLLTYNDDTYILKEEDASLLVNIIASMQ